MMLQRRNFGSNLFDEMFNNPFFGGVDNGMMKTNLEEKGNKYVLDMELPGFDKKDIQIQLDNGYLTVSAEKSERMIARMTMEITFSKKDSMDSAQEAFM